MELYLIRHGRQSSRLCNVNVDLSPEGRRQAALLGHTIVSILSSSILAALLSKAPVGSSAKIRDGFVPAGTGRMHGR